MPLRQLDKRFRITCLPRAVDAAREWGATHVISLLDPELPDEFVPKIQKGEHIVARLRDQESADVTQHFPELIKSLFETTRSAVEDRSARILVHCHMGVSRSTAFAYSLIAYRAGAGAEQDAFEAFMKIVNKPWPNRRIVEIMDAYLGREGRMLEPLDDMRARHPRRLDAWRRFNGSRGLPEGSAQYKR